MKCTVDLSSDLQYDPQTWCSHYDNGTATYRIKDFPWVSVWNLSSSTTFPLLIFHWLSFLPLFWSSLTKRIHWWQRNQTCGWQFLCITKSWLLFPWNPVIDKAMAEVCRCRKRLLWLTMYCWFHRCSIWKWHISVGHLNGTNSI